MATKTQDKTLPFGVTIRFGEEEEIGTSQEYRFSTRKELQAFIDGVDAAAGWQDYDILAATYPPGYSGEVIAPTV